MSRPAIHEYAAQVPEPTASEYAALYEDIRAHGLREPVVLYADKVLDGRTRESICHALGIEIATREFAGTEADAAAFVVSANVHRRHLTTPQRAMVAARLLPIMRERAAERKGGRPKKAEERVPQVSRGPQARDEAANAVGGVTGRSVEKAERIAQLSPSVAARVLNGSVDSLEKGLREAEDKARNSDREAPPPAPSAPSVPKRPRWSTDMATIVTKLAKLAADAEAHGPPAEADAIADRHRQAHELLDRLAPTIRTLNGES